MAIEYLWQATGYNFNTCRRRSNPWTIVSLLVPIATLSLAGFCSLLTAHSVLTFAPKCSVRWACFQQQFWTSPPWLLLPAQGCYCMSHPGLLAPWWVPVLKGAGSSLSLHRRGQGVLHSTSSRKGKKDLKYFLSLTFEKSRPFQCSCVSLVACSTAQSSTPLWCSAHSIINFSKE